MQIYGSSRRLFYCQSDIALWGEECNNSVSLNNTRVGVIESQFQWAACGGEQMTADRLRGSECVFMSIICGEV